MANAIILAAGLGSRFGKVTENISKTLLSIGGVPNIERTILFLKENGIDDIYVVVGYLKEKFTYLEEKYNVHLIHNDKYDVYNNRYSMYLALEYFGDSFIIEGDVVFIRPELKIPLESTYYTAIRNEDTVEWVPVLNKEGYVCNMRVTDEKDYALSGLSYWSEIDANIIRDNFSAFIDEDSLLDKSGYWDDIPVTLYNQLHVRREIIPTNALMEMDTWEQYEVINDIVCKHSKL